MKTLIVVALASVCGACDGRAASVVAEDGGHCPAAPAVDMGPAPSEDLAPADSSNALCVAACTSATTYDASMSTWAGGLMCHCLAPGNPIPAHRDFILDLSTCARPIQ